jgi:hypothetical protein
MSRSRRILAAAVLCTSTAVQSQHNEPADQQRGELLYEGGLPLNGQLRGHSQALPAAAVRCINCHEPSRRPVPGGDADAALAGAGARFAPPLDQPSLTRFHARRGGPSTRYDEATFCRAMRTSVDPGEVLLRKAMPQYAVDDDDCRALWRFLSQRPAAKGNPP